jgi:hypothetical protein
MHEDTPGDKQAVFVDISPKLIWYEAAHESLLVAMEHTRKNRPLNLRKGQQHMMVLLSESKRVLPNR